MRNNEHNCIKIAMNTLLSVCVISRRRVLEFCFVLFHVGVQKEGKYPCTQWRSQADPGWR